MELPEEFYVVVGEFDTSEKRHQESGAAKPIVFETTANFASKKHALGMAKRYEANGYGETKIGRVIFSDLDQAKPVKAVAGLLDGDSRKLDDLIGALHEIANEHGSIGMPIDSDPRMDQSRLAILRWVRSL